MSNFPIFVGNISPDVQTKDLRNLFAQCGRIKEVTILPENNGFVNYACPDDAIRAINTFGAFRFFGKKLYVSASKELEEFTSSRTQVPRRHSSSDHYPRNEHHRDYPKHHHERRNSDRSVSYRSRSTSFDERYEAPPQKRRFYERENHHFHRKYEEREYVPSKRKITITPPSSRYEGRVVHSCLYRYEFTFYFLLAEYAFTCFADRSSSSRRSFTTSKSKSKSRSRSRSKSGSHSRSKSRSRSDSRSRSRSPTSRSSPHSRSRSPAYSPSDLRNVLSKRVKTEEKDEDNEELDYEMPSDDETENRNEVAEANTSHLTVIDEVKEEDELEEVAKEELKEEEGEFEEIKISNLNSNVQKNDLEDLLSVYGEIHDINFNDQDGTAFIRMKCPRDSIEEAIHTLDESQWMDNENIRVEALYEIWIWSPVEIKDSFAKDMSDHFSSIGTVKKAKLLQRQTDILSLKIFCSRDQIIECLSEMNSTFLYKEQHLKAKFPEGEENDTELGPQIQNYPKESLFPKEATSIPKISTDPKKCVRELWLWIPANLRKTFLKDMETVIAQYGKVKAKGWKNNYIYIQLESSEKQAVKAVSETQGLAYKSEKVRIKFASNTPDDDLHKEEAYAIMLRGYAKVIIPTEKPNQVFADNEKKESAKNIQKETKPKPSRAKTPPGPKIKIGPINCINSVQYDAQIIPSIEGSIYSVSSKLILIAFNLSSSSGNSAGRFARLKPGHMYVDGKHNLGSLLKDSKTQDWPEDIRNIFHVGSFVIMDVRRLSKMDEDEMYELTHEQVMYETTLVWKASKPDLVIKENTPAAKGIVVKLWPNWALLRPVAHVGQQYQHLILLTKENFHTADPEETKSLLSHLEIGDTLALIAKPVDYLPMAEKARSLEFFAERTDNIKYEASLAWHLATEIDPLSVLQKRKGGLLKDNIFNFEIDDLCSFISVSSDQEPISFFATSSTVNLPLPKNANPKYKRWTGVVEELHKPDGGLIRLTDSKAMHFAPDRQLVYFHRSRLVVNGVKVSNNDVLEEEIAVGDNVQVDMVMNQIDMTTAFISQPNVYWVAVSVKANLSERGLNVANKLRAEVENEDEMIRNETIDVNFIEKKIETLFVRIGINFRLFSSFIGC